MKTHCKCAVQYSKGTVTPVGIIKQTLKLHQRVNNLIEAEPLRLIPCQSCVSIIATDLNKMTYPLKHNAFLLFRCIILEHGVDPCSPFFTAG